MANLISANLKASATQAMKDIFDSFKRDTQIRVYKTAKKEITVQDADFIAGFGSFNQGGSTQFTEESSYQDFDARIWYLDFQPIKGFVQGDDEIQARFKHSWGQIKIQVEEDAYNYLKDGVSFHIFGEKCRIVEDFRRIGILDEVQFYQFVLQKVN